MNRVVHQWRVAALAVAVAVVAVGAASLAPAAHAIAQPRVTLGVGQLKTVHGSLIGSTLAYEDAQSELFTSDGNPAVEPSHCDGDGSDPTDPAGTDCDDIPITLAVPKATLATHDYLLTATLTWNEGLTLHPPASASFPEHSLRAYLWQNPLPDIIKDGKDTGTHAPPSLAAVGEDPPAKLALVDPIALTYNLVITNTHEPTNYDLTIRLDDLSGPLPIDLSATTGGPASNASTAAAPAKPVVSQTATTPAAPGFTAPTSGPAVPGLAGVGADRDLDSAGASNLDLSSVRRALTGRKADLGPPGPASGAGLLLWLVVLPVVLLGLAAAWLARRRSGLLKL
jgi:hypothetical protein